MLPQLVLICKVAQPNIRVARQGVELVEPRPMLRTNRLRATRAIMVHQSKIQSRRLDRISRWQAILSMVSARLILLILEIVSSIRCKLLTVVTFNNILIIKETIS